MRVSVIASATGFCVVVAMAALTAAQGTSVPDKTWTDVFDVQPGELKTTGRNPYFVLEPGYTQVLRDGSEELTITVLNETKLIAGVETRVVEERETKGGTPVEVSRNYFAISTRTNSVFYFGEDVDMYKDGKVVNHEGSWLAGVKGARFGLMMPGLPLLKARYYQEVAPGLAMDRAEVVSLSDTLKTPAGTFRNVLKTTESSPLEPLLKESKFYGAGIGLLQDGSMLLVTYGPAK